MTKYKALQEIIITGQKDRVKAVVQSLIDSGTDPSEVISEGLINAMSQVGERWKAGDLFIPEVILSAEAMKEGMAIARPLILKDQASSFNLGKVVMATIQGDVHDIGKNIVGMLMESNGFELVDLGTDVPVNKCVEAVIREKPDILGLSALLTTTMENMKEVIESLKEAGVRDKVRVMIGGAPVTQEFADTIGADGYAADGLSAVNKAKELL
jgi:5-methyltetrahydrofolate--homocysteine methyltransferase